MPFRITALPGEPFEPLFAMDDTALHARLARRVVADRQPGFPCRVSLVDAAPGETLVLVHYRHQAVATPFRASHAVTFARAPCSAGPASTKCRRCFGRAPCRCGASMAKE